ncbi:hypothetical protein K470DRAFT_264963 [Piedraia hortae CBS 480.64]|uniref:Uncharacterized protein n=1 Tax=Piedraia hortae CBS 480.64 TaxID=1314780 RepID=A0A6A7BZ51_9PEZI|nr:hypothetical protein K470DRAFT_264963 [Piedraia hortae CBS 480.64]
MSQHNSSPQGHADTTPSSLEGQSGATGPASPTQQHENLMNSLVYAFENLTIDNGVKMCQTVVWVLSQEPPGAIAAEVLQASVQFACNVAIWNPSLAKACVQFCHRTVRIINPEFRGEGDEEEVTSRGRVISGRNIFRQFLRDECQCQHK